MYYVITPYFNYLTIHYFNSIDQANRFINYFNNIVYNNPNFPSYGIY